MLPRWARRWLDLRPDEVFPAGLMAVYFFLAIAVYYVVKPIRNSVFVQRVGADNLPFVYILTAVVVGVIASYYARRVDRMRRVSLLLGTFGLLALSHLLFWWVLRGGGLLASGAFYIWVKLYPLLLVSQFWLVANDLFDTRQAKRLFGPIGAGGILGGIAGAAVAGQLATRIGTGKLLPLSAAIFVLCSGIVVLLAWRYPVLRHRPVPQGVESATATVAGSGAWAELRASSHLRTIALLLGVTVVVSTLVDWQFNKGVELFVPGEDEKTAYFGRFFAVVNASSVVVQLVLTSWVLRNFGVGIGMLLLPLGLMTGSLGILMHPALWTTTLSKGLDGTLRYSLDQSTRELLFLPVPPAAKYRVKPLIDVAVYRGGTGLAGVLLLLGTSVFSLSVREMSVLVATLTFAWLAITLKMRREFKESVKHLLDVQPVSPDDRVTRRLEPVARRELVRALDSADESRLAYALALLLGAPGADLEPKLIPLLSHPSQTVRARALRLLFESRSRRPTPEAREMLADPAMEVRVEAIRCICEELGADPLARLRAFLADPDERLKAAAVACYVNRFGKQAWPLAETLFGELIGGPGRDGVERRALVAEAIGLLESAPGLHRFLEALYADPDPHVRRTALASAARLHDPNLVPSMASRLLGPDHALAGQALRAYGVAALEPLLALLRDGAVPLPHRAEIGHLLVNLRDARAEDALLKKIWGLTPDLRTVILEELLASHKDGPRSSLRADLVEGIFGAELDLAYEFTACEAALSEGRDPESCLAVQVTRERKEESLHRAFLALALLYGPDDILTAYAGLRANRREDRRAAFELLENVLRRPDRKALAPLCDPERTSADAIAYAMRRLGRIPRSPGEAVRHLRRSRDRWAAVTAWYSSGEGSLPHLPPLEVRPPFVRSGPATEAIEQLLPREPARLRALVERVDLLRKVEPFRAAGSEDLARIVAIARELNVQAATEIFRRGEPAQALCILLAGKVVLERNGQETEVLRPVACIDPLAAVTGLPHTCNVRAAPASRFLVIPAEELRELLGARRALRDAVLDALAAAAPSLRPERSEAERSEADRSEAEAVTDSGRA